MKLLKQYGLIFTAALFAFAFNAHAQNAGVVRAGQIDGSVSVFNPATGETVALESGVEFTPPATIITDDNSTVLLLLSNGSSIEVQPGSRVEIAHFSQQPFAAGEQSFFAGQEPSTSQLSVRVLSGAVVANSSAPNAGSNFTISTPTSTVDVSGPGTVVVGFDADTSSSSVSNVSSTVTYEVAGGQSTPLPAGQTLNVPASQGSTGLVVGETSVNPNSAETNNLAASAEQNIAAVGQGSGSTPASAPRVSRGPSPITEVNPDLIDPTSTGPNAAL